MHRFADAEEADLAAAVRAYQQDLARFFGILVESAPRVFDLASLGWATMGIFNRAWRTMVLVAGALRVRSGMIGSCGWCKSSLKERWDGDDSRG